MEMQQPHQCTRGHYLPNRRQIPASLHGACLAGPLTGRCNARTATRNTTHLRCHRFLGCCGRDFVRENQPPSHAAADTGFHLRSDMRHVELKNPGEIAFWTVELGATEAELREAVRQSGPVVKDVRRYISMIRHYLADVRNYLSGISGPPSA